MVDMVYIPSPSGLKFHKAMDVDTGFVRGLMGPIGSGKSVTCVLDLMMIAMAQEPDVAGIRRTKFAIIRNTYRELLDTTVETFFTWISKDAGHWSAMNMSFKLNQSLEDGTTVETEFLFRALDKPADVKKLLSLEITAAWINEAREIGKVVVDMVQGRVGRFPPKVFGVEATFFGLIMDTNPPDTDHWWYTLFEERLPDNHKLFKQPSGTSESPENIENLPRNYYKNIEAGKDQEWINVYVHGLYGFLADGKPVYPEYKDDVHHIDTQPDIEPTDTIYIGIDFGLTPAASFGRITASGQFQVFDELVTFDMGAVNFGRILKQKISHDFPNNPLEIYGDPAGDFRAQTDEVTPFMILNEQGVFAVPTYTNDPIIRREVVADYLQRLDFNAQPAFVVCPKAKFTRKAFSGGYCYKRLQVTGEQRFVDKPDKNKFSHISDAVQYMFLGAVGGDRVTGTFSAEPIEYSDIGIV